MSEKNGNGGPWLAFANFNSPNGETWHITIRHGAREEEVVDMFDMITRASETAKNRGFDGIVEGSEMGGTQWKSGMPVSLLVAERARRKAAMEKAKEDQARAQARKVAAAEASTRQGTGNRPAARATPPTTTPAPARPAQQPDGDGQFKHGWDLKKSPIEISKIIVQGTKDKPQVQLWSPNSGLRHAVWSNVSPKVIMACFIRDYDLSGMVTVDGKEMTRQAAANLMITEIGKEIDGLQWFVHWTPSPQNASWKDITRIEIPKWKDIANDGGVPS